MSKSRDTKPESSNTAELRPEQSPGAANYFSPSPGKVETFKVKKGIWRTYDATDGLPGAPSHLLQDNWGYLWIGTNAGLCRYDGTEFITYTTADGLAGNYVKALCEGNQEKLWIGTENGLSCLDGKGFTNYTTEDGLPDSDIKALCTDNQGRLWVGTQKGLSCLRNDRFINYKTADGLIDNDVAALCPGGQDGIWIGTPNGVSRFDGEHFMTLTTDIGVAPGPNIWEDRRGRLWIASGAGAHCFDGQQFRTYTHDDGLVDVQNFVLSIYEDSQGRMWFGQWAGVSCFDGSRFTNYGEGLWSGGIFCIIEDREGQMWFAHGRSCGLSCYDAETIGLLTDSPAGWTSTQDRKGRVWCGGIGIFGICLDSESSEVEQRRIPFTKGGIYFMVDSRDQLWISPYHGGLYCYDSSDAAWEAAGGDESYKPRHFGISDSLADEFYTIPLLEMEDGTIWFSSSPSHQLSRFDPEQLPDGKPLESIDTKGDIRCLIKDKSGKLWMGGMYGGAGLSCWDGSKLIAYTEEDGLPNNCILSLLEDDSGKIWIGTIHGLCCFDGQEFVIYGEEYNLRNLHHWQSIKDSSGQMWFAARGGVYRTDGKHFQWLTEDDGLPSNNVNAVLPQSDGFMIICTNKGLVRYRLTAVLPPRVDIREVTADQVYQNPDEIELTTTAASLLTISYHGLSLATKRMRYSYILEGYDEQWHETWERQVRYKNLPEGAYIFKVIAINRDLVTSESPAILKLKVVPDPRDLMVNELKSDLRVREQQLAFLQREMGRKYQFESIVGKSEAIEWVRSMMDRAIDSGLNVLITGETGTGKELVANGIHLNSSRKDKPLIPFNCGAISKELVGSELFGHRKGSFTGAIEDKMGLFEVANGGTVVLDEIGDMPLDVQSNLLRVLEQRKVHRLGEFTLRDVDVRVIAMTNRPLLKEVREGRFREDLYYRLNRFNIYIPPLRDRKDDIPLLAEYFYQEACRDLGKELDGFAPGVMDMLGSYPWPGNVRELRNEVHRACVLVQEGSPTQVYHFSSQITQGESLMQQVISEQLSYGESLDQFRRRLVEEALRRTDGNRTQAAKRLGMDAANLRRLIRTLGIKV